MPSIAFILFVGAFVVGFLSIVWNLYLTANILRLVNQIDPAKATVLKGGRVPVLGKLIWVDPVSLFVFVHSRLPENEELRMRVRQMRRAEMVMLVAAATYMIAMLAL